MIVGMWPGDVTVSQVRIQQLLIQGGSLTDAALGGRTLPELVTVHPAGRPGYVVTVAVLLVARVVGVQPPAFGCTIDEDESR